MTQDQRVENVGAITLPHLDVGTGDASGLNGEPTALVYRLYRKLVAGKPPRLDQQHGFRDIGGLHGGECKPARRGHFRGVRSPELELFERLCHPCQTRDEVVITKGIGKPYVARSSKRLSGYDCHVRCFE